MSKHTITPRYLRGAGRTSVAVQGSTPLLGRSVRIGVENVREVQGRHLEAGLLLPSGLILEATHNDIDGEVRLEMLGSTIHYVDHDETITVLAAVDRDVLDGLTVGEFMRRKHA